MDKFRFRPISALTLLIGAAHLAPAAAQSALTIYNQDFAVVRERVPLALAAGVHTVTFSGATLRLEPDSVVLRDPSDVASLRILEQSYRADTFSQGLLLSLNEGKELDFLVRDQNGKESLIHGKVIRSGYSPGGGEAESPIVEVDGKLRFSLPGEPIFPTLSDQAVLKPTLTWKIATDRTVRLDAELGYVTGGLNWQAAYNFVAPEKGDTLDVVGWVTLTNASGKTFENASLKLMAGKVNKLAPAGGARWGGPARGAPMIFDKSDITVAEKSFDEFHLYSLPRPLTLHDRETKQVEFMRGAGIKAPPVYVYDGAANYGFGNHFTSINLEASYGTQSNSKVSVIREFKNSQENGLGLPLPEGRTRFYRRDDSDGRLEFIGESTIGHTAKDENLKLYLGDAFDLVGERKRTDFRSNNREDYAEESFAITLRNHKADPVEIRVVEHLYRWSAWEIVEKSDDFTKTDAQTVEFHIQVKPDEERKVTYRVRYDWR